MDSKHNKPCITLQIRGTGEDFNLIYTCGCRQNWFCFLIFSFKLLKIDIFLFGFSMPNIHMSTSKPSIGQMVLEVTFFYNLKKSFTIWKCLTLSRVWSFNTWKVLPLTERETNYKLQAFQINKLIKTQSIIHHHHNSLHKLTRKSILSSFLSPHQFTPHRKMTLKTQSTASDINPFVEADVS